MESSDHGRQVRQMFTGIARRYDLLNRLMTFGQDRRWRRQTVRALRLSQGETLLDIGAGTGDLAFEAMRQSPGTHVVACDFTPAMLHYGLRRHMSDQIDWIVADAHALPFASHSFAATMSGFLLRNVVDVDRTLSEQARVLAPGGRIASLDTTPPQSPFFQPLINFYLERIIPALGRLFAGDENAYRYLPQTTQAFLDADALRERFTTCGFSDVHFIRRMAGTIAIHWGLKSDFAGNMQNSVPETKHKSEASEA